MNSLLKTTHLVIAAAIFWIPLAGISQLMDDFEGGSLRGWYLEGDGTATLSQIFANPGSSLRVADPASGDINYINAPSRYLGNWYSGLGQNDTISIDIYVQSTDPDTLVGILPAFQLSGPGGKASVLNGLKLTRNVWHQIKVPLDSTQWTIDQGSWKSLLENVNLFRIRAEYVRGVENVYMDNIRVSLSPERGTIAGNLCTSFEDTTYEGWNFADNGALSLSDEHGNPGIGIRIGDASNKLTQAIAPSRFHGDWTALLDSGYLSFDLKITTSSNNLVNKGYLVRLSGNGATAKVLPPDSVLRLCLNQWHTYTFLIDSSTWTMISGSWDSLIVSVDEIRLELEFINGSETTSFDNFCLAAPEYGSTSISRNEAKVNVLIFPNPAQGQFTVRSSEAVITSIALYDLAGRRVQAEVNLGRQEALVSSRYQGLVIVEVQSSQGVWFQKMRLE